MCEFFHSDLKSDVVLEKQHDQMFFPVTIDFGRTVAFSKAKNPVPKTSILKRYPNQGKLIKLTIKANIMPSGIM